MCQNGDRLPYGPTRLSETPIKSRRDNVEQAFPAKLLGGHERFRTTRLAGERERYEELAETGQKPDTMVIACCDSRSSPETIFDAAPGEMFVVRNVANIMPPYEQNGEYHGTSAALEFAVQELRVRHIVVMGHGRCGGIKAFRRQLTGNDHQPLSPGNFIGRWISLLEPAAARIVRVEGESAEALQTKLEEESIRQSIEHLKSFPCVSILLERAQIALHGAWFDISTGELSVLNLRTGQFEQPV